MKESTKNGFKGVGFTLIELLVVIAILGVLAAILVPAIRKALDAQEAREQAAMPIPTKPITYDEVEVFEDEEPKPVETDEEYDVLEEGEYLYYVVYNFGSGSGASTAKSRLEAKNWATIYGEGSIGWEVKKRLIENNNIKPSYFIIEGFQLLDYRPILPKNY